MTDEEKIPTELPPTPKMEVLTESFSSRGSNDADLQPQKSMPQDSAD